PPLFFFSPPPRHTPLLWRGGGALMFKRHTINVAYMIHDTIALAIPIKHVHPAGKCNRAMSSILKKHRTTSTNPEDAEMEAELMDEIDEIDDAPTDSRWDKLKDLNLD
ncbi:MAG: DUF177 domain-containing protein, partial [Muribaculaceae bacterium]|nr:DUF177 domain-containing protein [Muribaculaceae bacterium]